MAYKPVYKPKPKPAKVSKRNAEYNDMLRRFPANAGGQDSSATLGMK